MAHQSAKRRRAHFSMLRNYQTADLITLANRGHGRDFRDDELLERG
jgi:hypothetical protein